MNINKYRSLSFEQRAIFNAKFSIIFNFILALGKVILSLFYGIFFLVAGIVNIFIMLSKLECFLGIKNPNKMSFKYRNILISIFLIIAGLQYAIYSTRMLISDIEMMDYNMYLGIIIALVSFIEITFAIKGLFNLYSKGHYYRNLKIINLCSAMTAIVLTEVALMSAASETDSSLTDSIFGLCVGILIVLLGIFIIIAPKFSITDRIHSVFKAKNTEEIIEDEVIEIKLTNSKFYSNYVYIGNKENDLINGKITKGKNPILKWNIFILIIVFTLSEILIFPYGVGALIRYFKNGKMINNLDNKMNELGYVKIEEGED